MAARRGHIIRFVYPMVDSWAERVETGVLLAGRYRLIARVGAGGMAVIYRAHDERLEREVAVKVLHPHLADDPELRRRFDIEARAAASLQHPNIVTVFDSGVPEQPPRLPYIVMEFVEGSSLRRVLSERGRLAPAEVLAILLPVCAALARAHERGVVHRDVKPENVLVARDRTVKVVDFGIARVLAASRLTSEGVLLATVHYVAPELVAGGRATPASDQYALGIMLAELLTGRRPLSAETPQAVALRHVSERVPPPSQLVPELSAAVDAVVLRATALDPPERYPDLNAMAEALRTAVGQEPRSVPPEPAAELTPVEEPALPTRRMRSAGAGDRAGRANRALPALAAVLAVVAVLSALGWLTLRSVPDTGVGGSAQPSATTSAPGEGADAGPGLSGAGDDEAGGDEAAEDDGAAPAEVTMPRVLGRDAEQARALLEAGPYRFTVRVDEATSATGVPAGQVQGQQPEARTTLAPGATVIINVSLGAPQVVVPELEGRSREEVEALLAQAGLTAIFSEEFSDQEPRPGVVVRQSIEAGERVDGGTEMQVVLSRGAETVQVPDMWLQPLDDARQELAALGLRVQVQERPRPYIAGIPVAAVGLVEDQQPGAGTSTARGTTVRLDTYVDRGPEVGALGD